MCDEIEILIVDDSQGRNGISSICENSIGNSVKYSILTVDPCNLCQARNYGLDSAVGEYVMFVDDDDLLISGALESLYKRAKETGSDMVFGGYQRIDSDGNILKGYPHKYFEGTGQEMTKLYLSDTCYTHGGAYLIKRKMLLDNHVRYSEDIRYSEDKLFLVQAFCTTNYVSCVEQEVYAYRLNFTSSLFKASPYRFDMVEVDRKVIHSLENRFPELYADDPELNEMLQRTILFCVKTVLWLGMPEEEVKEYIARHNCIEDIDDRLPLDLKTELTQFHNYLDAYLKYQKENYKPNGLTKRFKDQYA